MRIDVLVTGQFPVNIPWQKMIDVLYRVEKIFLNMPDHDVKIRYHTWNKLEMLSKFVPQSQMMIRARDQVLLTQEPEVYNPYREQKKFIDTPRWTEQVKKHGGPYVEGRKSNYRALQIMSTLDLINSIKEPPDLYIRTRWDSLIDYTFDFEKYIQMAAQGTVVGFQLNCNPEDPWWTIRERFEKHDHWEEKHLKTNGWWHQHVFDYMVMFKPEYFRTQVVNHWWKHKLLLAAEWGWWQVLCHNGDEEPRPHVNVNGVVPIIRQMEGIPHA